LHFEDILLDPKLDSKVLTDNLSVDLDGKNYFYESNETPNMTIELSKEVRQQAISSIERYFQENMDEKIGNIAASALLGFFIEEIGPVIYNMAVAEVQERIQTRVMEIDLEVNLNNRAVFMGQGQGQRSGFACQTKAVVVTR
jgi:uncharacterized protein (DUF2164 family)